MVCFRERGQAIRGFLPALFVVSGNTGIIARKPGSSLRLRYVAQEVLEPGSTLQIRHIIEGKEQGVRQEEACQRSVIQGL